MACDSFVLIPKRTDTATVTINYNTLDANGRRAYTILKGAANTWLDCNFTLIVTAAATDAGDTLDVKIQHSHNADDTDSPAWDDFVHFAQCAGNGGAVQKIAQWTRAVTPETESRAPNTSLAAGNVVQGPIGPDLRVVATLADSGDANTSYTWKLIASPMQTA